MNWMVDPQAPTTVETMICQLAGVCDGAREHDGQGFSGADTEFGHSLAARAQQGRAYTVKQATAALKLVRKYRRQLGGQVLVEAFLQKPVFRMQPLDPMAAQPTQPPQPSTDRQLTSRDRVAVLAFRYDPALVAAVKGIQGEHRGVRFRASWDPASRVWTVPVNESSIGPIMALAEQWGFSIEDRFTTYLERVRERTQESHMMLALNQGQHVTVTEDSIIIAVEDAAILEEFERALGKA